MARAALPAPACERLRDMLGAKRPAQIVDFSSLDRRRFPPEFRFGPELTISVGHRLYLIHELAIGEIPPHVRKAAEQIGSRANLNIIALARLAPGEDPAVFGSAVISDCAGLGIGLFLESPNGVVAVLPPRFRLPRRREAPENEFGHIPSWLLERIERSQTFSVYMTRSFSRFIMRYRNATRRSAPAASIESRLLHRLAEAIADGDKRLFFPHHLLHTLEGYEEGGADTGSRDHFFHTFINLFTGFVLLGELFEDRRDTAHPDRFLRDNKGIAKSKIWETLWSLTCLFHDPGYMGQNLWSTLHSVFGVPFNAREAPEMPEAMTDMIARIWEQYGVARSDLLGLFKRTCGYWQPESCGPDVTDHFDPALRSAYFGEAGPNHSIISALGLIQRCRNYTSYRGKKYDPNMALRACEIAGLSMLFHDQRCRMKLEAAGLLPVAFEELPYASTLMFVDALQDERRDVESGSFPRQGLLDSLTVDPAQRLVTASIDIRRTPATRWPFLISEYENVTSWINRDSDTRFIIDYRSAADLHLLAV